MTQPPSLRPTESPSPQNGQTHPDPAAPAPARGARRILWLMLGWVSVGLGIVGIVLPVLPTTPFLILAVCAFGKSSPRLAQWLRSHPRFGPMLLDWEAHRAIRPRHKRMALGTMAAVWVLSALAGAPVWVLGVQAVCMGGAGLFIATRSNGPV